MIKIYKTILIFFIIISNFFELSVTCTASITNNINDVDRLKMIKDKRILTVASSNDVPFGFIDPNSKKFTGIDGDILTEIFRRLGVNRIEMKEVPFQYLLEQLNIDNSIDIVASGLSITDDREKIASFSSPWYKDSESIIIPKSSKISSKNDLKDKVIGAQKGTIFLDLAQKWKKEGLVNNIIVFETQPELLSAVSSGKTISAAIADCAVASYFLSQNKDLNLKMLDPYEPEYTGVIAGAVRKNDVTLLNAINTTIAEMKKDNTLSQILQKYGLNSYYMVPA